MISEDKIREVLEGAGIVGSPRDELVLQFREILEKKDVKENSKTMEDLEELINSEEDPFRKASLVARKISRKIDNFEY